MVLGYAGLTTDKELAEKVIIAGISGLGGFGAGVPASGGGSANGLYTYLQPDTHLTFAYVDLWHDFTPAVRAGLEYGQYDSLYTTGLNALDNRVMMSWFYLF